MEWQEICDHPQLRDLSFKVETNQWGHLEMTPASNEHGLFQALIVQWLARLGPQGRVISECSVLTSAGVKVADVAWAEKAFFERHRRANPYPEAPDLVIEVLSPSNSEQEMDEKKALYFARGAREFWTCAQDGKVRCFDRHRELSRSGLIPGFPNIIEIDFA
ncbi:Uma2 family endonuclease [Candidatus Thiosymbion oneisti]|uniref:Uma2 family endonuclease n=1 Tax=Candidatus Thiosymbion oneisti TaxID=589554 RepID=UPI000B2F8DB4|nr:Uma2 family endonuclease [Candidatus Thiosymbion oneisti]